MIINRRRYERDLEQAYERGCRETSERHYQEEEKRIMHCAINELQAKIRKMEATTESDCCNEQTAILNF